MNRLNAIKTDPNCFVAKRYQQILDGEIKKTPLEIIEWLDEEANDVSMDMSSKRALYMFYEMGFRVIVKDTGYDTIDLWGESDLCSIRCKITPFIRQLFDDMPKGTHNLKELIERSVCANEMH